MACRSVTLTPPARRPLAPLLPLPPLPGVADLCCPVPNVISADAPNTDHVLMRMAHPGADYLTEARRQCTPPTPPPATAHLLQRPTRHHLRFHRSIRITHRSHRGGVTARRLHFRPIPPPAPAKAQRRPSEARPDQRQRVPYKTSRRGTSGSCRDTCCRAWRTWASKHNWPTRQLMLAWLGTHLVILRRQKRNVTHSFFIHSNQP